MKKNSVLGLLEMTVMLLVFALAAALCLRLFAWSDSTIHDSIRRDDALLELQSAAEILKHNDGDYEKSAQLYGGSWNGSCWKISGDRYDITVTPENTGIIGLGGARLEAVTEDRVLASIMVRWQEVSYGK